MKSELIFVLIFQILAVTATGDGVSVIGAVIGPIAAVLIILIVSVLGYYCYRKNKLHEENARRAAGCVNNRHSLGNQDGYPISLHTPPPSYFQNVVEHPSTNHQVDLPPSYSTHMSLYHTSASGQPPITGNIMRGLDNPAFLSRSISSFSDLPNMADVLLTSSRTSIPAAVTSEGSSKLNKFSDSAQGDSIESKVTSNRSQFIFENPQFVTSFEDDHNAPVNALNERFESYSDSESEFPSNNMGGRWLDSIKNQAQPVKQTVNHLKAKQTHKVNQFNKSHKNSTANKVKQPPLHDKCSSSTQQLYNKKGAKKIKVESSDSGAEVSSNPRGSSNDTRLSKISSDSGLGEAVTSSKSKPNFKLKWDPVNTSGQKLNRSLSTEV